jgi:hypothetical protein
VFTANADLGFETDQQFETKQLVVRRERRSRVERLVKRDAKKWGETNGFVSRGMSFPALLVQLVEVTPQSNDQIFRMGYQFHF